MLSPGTLEGLSQELADVFIPLEDSLAADGVDRLLGTLGISTPDGLLQAPALAGALTNGLDAATALPSLVDAMSEALGGTDPAAATAAGVALVEGIEKLVTAIGAIGGAIDSARSSLASLTPAQQTELADFSATFAARLVDELFAGYLRRRMPQVYAGLVVGGVIEVTRVDAGNDAGSLLVPCVRRTFHYDRGLRLITDPLGLLRDVYGWGASSFDGRALFVALQEALDALKMPAEILETPGSPPILEAFAFSATPSPGPPAPGLDVTLRFPANLSNSPSTDDGDWKITATTKASFEADVDAIIRPPLDVSFHLPSGSADLLVSVDAQRSPSASPILLVGQMQGTRLEAANLEGRTSLQAHWDSTTADAVTLAPTFEVSVTGATLVVSSSGADSFSGAVLGGRDARPSLDVDVSWSPTAGLRFGASGTTSLDVPVHEQLGPLTVDTLHLAVRAQDGAAELDLAASIGATLGPVAVAVQNIGATIRLSFPAGGGNVGPVQIDAGFRPPDGLGLSIEAPGITGGGFVSYDDTTGRYSGALQLDVQGIAIQAIGLLETRLPGGRPGYSFVILVCSEFTPIQLGLGFTLNGVGGLAGIHRSADSKALLAAIRKPGAMDHILFPKDVVKDAPQILSDMETFFPAAEGRYVFCPMAIVGWGTGDLVTAEVGLLVLLPSPVLIALLGELNVLLPSPLVKTVEIHVDVLGLVDFGAKLFALDASLHDSRIGQATLSGDMAVRHSWSDPPSFALSIGGFNPHFQPPAGFPTLRRLSVDLGSADPHIGLKGYLALTSNTFQVGAEVDVSASAGPFSVQGSLGFDALFTFSPFSFEVDISGSVALQYDGSTLAGVHLDAMLSGPSPWHVKGDVCISLLFFDVCGGFSATFGEARHDTLAAPDASNLLTAAMQDPRSWSSTLAPGALAVVTVSAPEGSAAPVLVDPAAGATMRERVVPMDLTLDLFGQASLPAPTSYSLDTDRATINGGSVRDVLVVEDYFARAQFQQMTSAQKLSAPSFERMDAGMTVGSLGLTMGAAVYEQLSYRTIVIDSPSGRRPGLTYTPSNEAMKAALASGPAADSALANRGMRRYAPPPGATPLVTMDEETYVVASTIDLSRSVVVPATGTKAAVLTALAAHLAAHPEDTGQLQVVPSHELLEVAA